MTSRIERLLISLIFALFAAGATLVIASAQSGTIVSALRNRPNLGE